jgi:hypothetical protein
LRGWIRPLQSVFIAPVTDGAGCRSCQLIYPEELDTVEAAYFYSIWNQCIGAIIQRYSYSFYHACDYQ